MEEWIAGLIGVLVGALISFIGTWLTLRFNYKQLYAQTVSNNRMEWINVWRANISKFLACAELIISNQCGECVLKKCCAACNGKDCKIIDYKKEFYEARGMITSRLNMQEDLHVLMFGAINQIDFKNEKDFIAKRECILQLEREILKIEWERVKNEAQGKKNNKG